MIGQPGTSKGSPSHALAEIRSVSNRLLALPESYQTLRDQYPADESGRERAWERTLEIARVNEATSVMIEPDYSDPNYRAEHDLVYSHLFPEPAARTVRLHFLRQDGRRGEDNSPTEYLGYISVRPVSHARVGTTILCQPPHIGQYVTASVSHAVEVLGQEMVLRAVPYMQCDGDVGLSSAAASAWICHAIGASRGWAPPVPVTALLPEFPGTPKTVSVRSHRGMTVEQLIDSLARCGLPAQFWSVDDLPFVGPLTEDPPAGQAERLEAVLHRYVDAGLPVILLTDHRAIVSIGCSRTADAGPATWVVHDPVGGPYLLRQTHELIEAGARGLCIPLPAGVYMSAEAAELRFVHILEVSALSDGPADLPAVGSVRRRVRLVTRFEYQRALGERHLDPEAVSAIREATLPAWLWLIEAVDRVSNDTVAEAIFDAAARDASPVVAAFLGPGCAILPYAAEEFTELKTMTPGWRGHDGALVDRKQT